MNTHSDDMSALAANWLAQGLDAAVFDLDGTLADTNIVRLFFHLRRDDFTSHAGYQAWRWWTHARHGARLWLMNRRDRAAFQREFFTWYERWTPAQLAAKGEDYFATVGRAALFPGPVGLLTRLRAHGVPIEIHSTNFTPFVAPFARHFNLAFSALPVHQAAGGCRVDTTTLSDFKTCALRPFAGRRIAVIADSVSDIPALERATFPLVIHSSIPSWASARGWPVMTPDGRLLRRHARPT